MTTKEVYTLTPTIGGSFSFGWKRMFDKFIYLLIIVIIAGIVTGPFQATWRADSFHLFLIPLVMLALAWGLLVVPVVTYGEKFLFLKAMREEEIDLKELFSGFTTNFVNIILANLIVVALVGLGIVLLFIPGIIVACRLAFVPYIVMDQKLDPIKAVERSWKMTGGHGWKIFFMAIISFFVIIAGVICLFVGVLISIMWIHAAFATLYQEVLNQEIKNNTIPIIEVHEA